MSRRASVVRAEVVGDAVQVWLTGPDRLDGPDGAGPFVLPGFWIRDHSRDPGSFDAATGQRTVDTFGIDLDLRPSAVQIVDGAVVVDWPGDDAPSVLPADLLDSIAGPRRGRSASGIAGPTQLWPLAAELGSGPEPVAFSELVAAASGDRARRALLVDIARFGFGRLAGAPGGDDGVAAIAERLGYVRRTIFGDIWPLAADLTEHADSAYGEGFLEPHTDGSYSHDAPGLQLFVCSERTGTGGESILVDGLAAAETLRADDPLAFDALTEVPVPGHYIEPGVELRASRPTIRLGDDGEVAQVTFNNYDRSPFLLPPDALRRWYEAYRALHALVVDRSAWWTWRLESGDALIVDNWRCLHGRMAFTGRRRFHGCYLNHEDLESALRVADT